MDSTEPQLEIKLYVPHSKSHPAGSTVSCSALSDAKNSQLACIKRFSLDSNWVTFDDLRTVIDQRLLNHWHLQMKPDSLLMYLDNEDEWVELTDENDWAEALECNLNLIHIFVPEVMPFDGQLPQQNQNQEQKQNQELNQKQKQQQQQRLKQRQDQKLQQQLEQRQQLYSSISHSQICCDSCQTLPVFGIRFKCRTRPDFDLCYDCYTGKTGREMRAKNHVFMELTNPFIDEAIQGCFMINGENWNVNGAARTRSDVPPDPDEEWIVDKIIDD